MRLLRINGVKVDIDNQTAIGVDSQSYGIKSPGVRKVNITNDFTIPATDHNLQIFGYADNPQSTSLNIYGLNTIEYWVNNQILISDARVRVNQITSNTPSNKNGRISLFVFQKPDVWDELKLLLWPDFVKDFIKWMQDVNGLPSKDNPFIGNFGEFIEPYTETTEGIKLPMYFGNLYNYDPDGGEQFLEDPNSIYLRYWPEIGDKADGGHFCVYIKTIFEYIEQKYNVDFLTAGSQKLGNIWDDAIATSLYIPVRDIGIRFVYTGSNVTGFYFEFNEDTKFLPLKDQKDKAGKKLYDLVNSFFQHLNIIKDEFDDNVIRLARFDDIKTLADVRDWSGNLSGQPKFKPFIDGFQRESRIKFKEIYEEGDQLLNSKVITCNNQNLDATTDLFDIDAYVCSFLNISGGVVPDLSPKESFKTFTFLLDNGLTDDIINIYQSEDGNEQRATFRLQKAALYSLDSEYNFLDEILTYPRYYEVEKWLTLNEIKDLEFFRQYYIRELNGSYFLNKISGYNPEKSNKPTKLELIYVSDKTPIKPPDLNYYTDGVGDPWTDGIGDIYY